MADCGNIPQVARIICPYFKMLSNDRRTIVCEGLTPGASSAMVFRTRAEQEKYSEKNCERYSYGHCPLARAVQLKLADEEEKAKRY